MRESQVERYLVKAMETLGGLCLKFVSPGRRSVPDRLVILPMHKFSLWVFFVEAKRPGEEPTKAQKRMHSLLRLLGMSVFIVDSIESVDDLVQTVEGDHNPDLWRSLI